MFKFFLEEDSRVESKTISVIEPVFKYVIFTFRTIVVIYYIGIKILEPKTWNITKVTEATKSLAAQMDADGQISYHYWND